MINVYVGDCCGNSFVVLDCRDIALDKQLKADLATRKIIKYGVDSALFLENSKNMDLFMEIYERDGSESESCGNGSILIACLLGLDIGEIEMKASNAAIFGDSEKQAILMNMKFSDVEEVTNNKNNCLFVKMGEPHMIFSVDDLVNFDLVEIGIKLQYKYPTGINVNAIQKINDVCYLIKTYERGVFAETKSCGTGSLSAYIAVSYFNGRISGGPIEFKSVGGSHWVSMDKDMLKLETLKENCKIKYIHRISQQVIQGLQVVQGSQLDLRIRPASCQNYPFDNVITDPRGVST